MYALHLQFGRKIVQRLKLLLIGFGRSPGREKTFIQPSASRACENLQAIILMADLLQLLAAGVRARDVR